MDAARSFAIHVLCRVKPLDFAGDVVRHILRVKASDMPSARLSGQQILPERGDIIANRRQDAHASNIDSRHLDNPLSMVWERQHR